MLVKKTTVTQRNVTRLWTVGTVLVGLVVPRITSSQMIGELEWARQSPVENKWQNLKSNWAKFPTPIILPIKPFWENVPLKVLHRHCEISGAEDASGRRLTRSVSQFPLGRKWKEKQKKKKDHSEQVFGTQVRCGGFHSPFALQLQKWSAAESHRKTRACLRQLLVS